MGLGPFPSLSTNAYPHEPTVVGAYYRVLAPLGYLDLFNTIHVFTKTNQSYNILGDLASILSKH